MPDEPVSAAPDAGITAPVTDPAPAATGVSWLLEESEELQNDPILNQFKSRQEALKAVGEMKRYADARVKLPDENATPEDLSKFYTRLGRPETPDGYEFTSVELPPTMPMDEGMVKAFKIKAHELGLTKKQADGVYVDYLNNVKQMNDKILADYDAGVNQQMDVLKGRWGNQFEPNKNAAIQAFNQFASPTLKATVEKEGWGNNPDFVELFHKISVATGEDTLRSPGTVNYSTIDEKIKTLDVEIFNMDVGDPMRSAKLQQREALYKERYPEQPE
jgi:hypothetical protein